MAHLVKRMSYLAERHMIMINDTVYKSIGGPEEKGIFACGYMEKNQLRSQLDFTVPYYSVFVLLEGEGDYWDETGFQARLQPGSVVQRLPGRLHSTRVDAAFPWREFFISFGCGIFSSLAELGLLDETRPVSACKVTRELVQEFDQLLKAMKTGGLFTELLRAEKIAASLFESQESDLEEGWIHSAKAVLSSNLREPLTEAAAAQQVGLGCESFRKQFKKFTGLSPMEFRCEQKMMTARLMLLGGSSIKETALSLGYSDAYSFSKQFKKKNNSSPGRFR